MTPQVLLITNIPTPYRIPLFNVLHDALGRRGIAFRVAFGALGYSRRQWRVDLGNCAFPSDVLSTFSFHFADPERVAFTYGGLSRVLRRERPTVVITNGFSIATTKLWLLSFLGRTAYVIWSGDIERHGVSRNWLRTLHRRLLIRRATAFVAYGSRAKSYLVSLGAPADRVSIGINTVDTAHFARAASPPSGSTSRYGPVKELLCIGELTPRKHVDQAIHLAKLLSRRRNDFVLRIIGSGPEEAALKELVRNLSLENVVRFEGYKQKEEMIACLASAYCFLFPTRHDIWGLVLVEAMAAGVPCVASLNAGATTDLIRHGENGFIVDFDDLEAVASTVETLLDDPHRQADIAGRAKMFVENHVTLNQSAEGFVAAIQNSIANRD